MNNPLLSKNSLFAAVALAGAISTPLAQASGNPFSNTELASGFNLNHAASGGGGGEGKSGVEGKCGDAKTCPEGKCGEGKCGEGKCGGEGHGEQCKDAGDKSHAEGKCGEGKCGEAMADDKKAAEKPAK
jgi:uncharacterized low-complexity protein